MKRLRYKNDRFTITSGFHFIKLNIWFYDNQYYFEFSPGYGNIWINLWKKTKNPDYSGDDKKYGFYFYGHNFIPDSFWVCWGKNRKCFNLAWKWKHYRTSVLKSDGTWEHEFAGKDNKKFWDYEIWDDLKFRQEFPYTYTTKKGAIQHRIAKIGVNEREFRWRSLYWFKYPRMINKTIDVEFQFGGPFIRNVIFEKKSGERYFSKREESGVGERVNSWKGGTTGCSYTMLKNETPEQTLRRMEKEREFN